jgi:serine/threonine-protein kinase
MKLDRWRQLESLYNKALEMDESRRVEFLREACAGDDELRHDVERLLAARPAAASFLEQPALQEVAHEFAATAAPSHQGNQDWIGREIGNYQFVSLVGAGGMGEVYRARDTKLKREVAIKVIPDEFSRDPERISRFQREAELLASLNHPNIAAIYDHQELNGSRFLILEMVPGETLADRIRRGPIPVEEALKIALQITEALEAAHERNVIHRDLKPANIKVTAEGTVKVLDFGLAKALADERAAEDTARTTLSMTEPGVILGTVAYMSPEQATGKPVDRRADIWAFGAVLYELLTGKPAFQGGDATEILTAVMTREPAHDALPAKTSAAIRNLLRRCLEKNLKRRLQHIGEARVLIEDDLAGVVSATAPGSSAAIAPRPPLWRRMAILSGAWLVGVAMAGGAVWFAVRSTAPPRVSRLLITPPSAAAPSLDRASLALTPDGTRVVYLGANNTALFVRSLDQLNATSLTGLGGPYGAFVSPDGQWIGFFDGVISMKKVAITGGPVGKIGRPGGTAQGASWGRDGTIIFATNLPTTGLLRIADAGGEPTVLTRPNREGGEADHLWPEILPGGQAVLFTITATSGGIDQAQVAVLDLRTRTQTVLIRGGSRARYVSSGHLVYAAAGKLHAVAFDLARLAVIGTPVTVEPEVPTDAGWAVAADGTLVYLSGGVSAKAANERSLVWVDRRGHETPIAGAPPRNYAFPRISPDGTRLALYIPDREIDIWLWDLGRANATLARATFDPTVDIFPVWSPDGRQLLFGSSRADAVNLFAQAADGGDVRQLTTSPNIQHATSVTPDGTRLVFTEIVPKTGQDIMQLRLDSRHAVTTLVQTSSDERNGEVSPDGRWLAYEADDSGRFNIYVRPFADVSSGRQWQVSTDGGIQPLWARNSQELFYLSAGALMRVGVEPGPTWTATGPTKLFEGRYGAAANQSGRTYDIALDGKRFLMIKPGEDPTAVPASLVVVQNWREELKRLVPSH